jgi:DNA methylase
LDPADVTRSHKAIVDPSPVSGLTHTFYRYPARFSPLFVRQAIKIFTAPRDVVVDPFMGGGTTLVEATALGRYAFGTDVSALAAFVARVKTRVYTESQLRRLRAWADGVSDQINMRRLAIYPIDWAERGYLKHLETRRTWRLAKATQQALGSVLHLSPARVEEFARCIILRTAQWAMDARREVPSIEQFRQRIIGFAREMLAGAEQYRRAVEIAFPESETPEPICLHRPANGLNNEPPSQGLPSPKLVLTSPPYPGVHVIYHRWQVDGRKRDPCAILDRKPARRLRSKVLHVG